MEIVRKNLFDVMEKLWINNISFNFRAGWSAFEEDYIEFPRYKNPPRVYHGEGGSFMYEMFSIVKNEKVIDFYEFDELIEIIKTYEIPNYA